MRNPFRTEEAAFRFLMLTIGYFGLIGIASVINKWAGLAVFLLLTGGVVAWWFTTRSAREKPVKQQPAPHPPGEKRLLVVANETVGGAELLDRLKRDAAGANTEVLVVVPALNSPLKHWVSDEDGARSAAQRAARGLARGDARGRDRGARRDRRRRPAAGDRGRPPHVRSGRARDLDASRGPLELARARRRRGGRERFDMPVTHVVVDLEAANTAEPSPTADAGQPSA